MHQIRLVSFGRILAGLVCLVMIVAAGCSGQPAVEDLSVHYEHVPCEDPLELYGCKPTMIHAIDQRDLEWVKRLVEEEGVDVNIGYPYYYGVTALMAAVQRNYEEAALYLIEQGADVNEVIPLDPLTEAEQNGMTRTAEAIRQRRGSWPEDSR
ncbi:MAG: ankyrin repeat domain-containing protein [Candidatus Omnitrophica bacterium]|nr:ankyrin repeat domain-containing protein [Candidatus Omnitrophota bacterium]